MPYQFKDNENIKLPMKRLWVFLCGLSLSISAFDILYGKYTIYDIAAIPMSVFGFWAIQFNGWYKIERRLAEYYMKRRSRRFDYFHK